MELLKAALRHLLTAPALNVILNLSISDALLEIIHHAGLKRMLSNLSSPRMRHGKGWYFLPLLLVFVAHAASASPVVWIAGPIRDAFVDSLPAYSIRRVDIKCDDGMALRLSDGTYLPCESFDLYVELMDLGRTAEAERLLLRPGK